MTFVLITGVFGSKREIYVLEKKVSTSGDFQVGGVVRVTCAPSQSFFLYGLLLYLCCYLN